MVSEDFIRNTNAYSLTKKIIGSNLTNSQLSQRNVWASTNFNKVTQSNLNLFQSDKLNKFDTLNQNFINSSNLENYNFFEESRMFLFNKYLFNNKLRYNSLVFDDSFEKYIKPIDDKSLNTFDLNYKLFVTSLDFNLKHFNLSLSDKLTNDTTRYEQNLFNYFIVSDSNSLLSNNDLNILINLTSQKQNNVL